MKCEKCGGSGVYGSGDGVCHRCEGTGVALPSRVRGSEHVWKIWFSGEYTGGGNPYSREYGAHDNEVRTTRKDWMELAEDSCTDRPLGEEYEQTCCALRQQYVREQMPLVQTRGRGAIVPSICEIVRMLAMAGGNGDEHDYWPMPRYERSRYLPTRYETHWYCESPTWRHLSGLHGSLDVVADPKPLGTAGWFCIVAQDSSDSYPWSRLAHYPSWDVALAASRYPNRRAITGPFASKEAAEAFVARKEVAHYPSWDVQSEASISQYCEMWLPVATRLIGPALPSS